MEIKTKRHAYNYVACVYIHYIAACCITISQTSVYNSPSHVSAQISHHKVEPMYRINC